MIKEAIVKIVNKGDLTYEEAYTVMNEIMGGQTTPTQNAAFLAALSTKSAQMCIRDSHKAKQFHKIKYLVSQNDVRVKRSFEQVSGEKARKI